jgi:two-component system OmpR family response regulator
MTTAGATQNHILMVDDDVDLNSLVTEYLARFGHRLVTATTAARGMAELRRERPDLIILDIMLPDTDGLTLCREIRNEFDIPIIMLTARGEVADRVLGLELGADDYLSKPFEPRELVVYDRSVDMLVSRLRDKLGDDSHTPRFIKTVRLTGYQFVGRQGA